MKEQLYIEPSARELLHRIGLADFEAVMKHSSGMTFSRHATRNTVQIVEGEGPTAQRLFLKRVFRVPLKHAMEDLLRGQLPRSQPLREWRAIDRCREAGIPVMEALAWGQRSLAGIPRQAFILVRAVPAPESLDEVLRRLGTPQADARTTLWRNRLARDLGGFVARIHEARLTWPDMVGKHIYPGRSGSTASHAWTFHLIDVERLSEGATPRNRQRDLRALLRSLRTTPLRTTDLLRFAIGYVGGSGRWSDLRRRVQTEFAWAEEVLRKRLSGGGPRLPWPDDALPPRQHRFVRSGRVLVNEPFIPLLMENGMVGFGSVFRYDRGQRLDKANIGTWRQRWRADLNHFGGRQEAIYLKRYDSPPFRDQLRRLLGGHAFHSTAWWEWRNIRRVAGAGIPTLTPVAFGEKMRGFVERQSFIATQGIPGVSLEQWVPEHWGQGRTVDARARRSLIEQAALLVRTLHAAGLFHRDLYLSHVFISTNHDGRVVLRLIDLQRVFRPHWRRHRWQVKDLAALHYSTPRNCLPLTDRIRFLRQYLGVRRLGPAGKSLVRDILAKSRRIEHHNRPSAATDR